MGAYAEADGFPALNGTLYDYWLSNAGVATSGGEVTIWTGQENGRTFDQGSSGGPTISGSNADFNNVQTLTFNGTDAGLGHTGTEIQGVDTGDIQIAIYGAPHGDGGGWGAIFGCSSDGNTPFVSEAVMKATSTNTIEFYAFPPGGTNSTNPDTYGKGLYAITMGAPDATGSPSLGAKLFNKNNATPVGGATYSSYENARQPFMLGAYNALNSAALHGKVDIAACVIWYNTTDLEADLDAIEAYFQGIYG